jgi:hypothetical protein
MPFPRGERLAPYRDCCAWQWFSWRYDRMTTQTVLRHGSTPFRDREVGPDQPQHSKRS